MQAVDVKQENANQEGRVKRKYIKKILVRKQRTRKVPKDHLEQECE